MDETANSGFDLRGLVRDVLGTAVEYEQARADANYWNQRPVTAGTVYTPSQVPAANMPAKKIPAWVWAGGLGAVALVLFIALRK